MNYIIKSVDVLLMALLHVTVSMPTQKQDNKIGLATLLGIEDDSMAEHRVQKRSSGTAVFTMNQESRNNMINLEAINSVSNQAYVSKTSFNNGLICPNKVSTGATDPDHKRSTCPWYYEADHNSTRFPTTILRAVSLCEYCIGSGGLHECIPIKQTIPGLKQEKQLDANGNFVWTQIEITTTVGFTCAGRRIAESVTKTIKPSTTTGKVTAAPTQDIWA